MTMASVCLQKLLAKNFNNRQGQHDVRDFSLVREVCVSDLKKILYVQLPRAILCKFEYEIQAQIEAVAAIYWYNYSSVTQR